ncbi:unnamed protein product [Adineta steineri]|uniref:Cilia-and flagella-associated protein 96 n=1 Tax=Adineta steineri TaxID=433720 RepID=A0A819LN50_9BILA|nr:unnamed protein product [Adineta steineri]
MAAGGKTDMDRIGLFKEMEYATIKDPYKEASRYPSKQKYRDIEKPPPEKTNFKINPSKKGTGYGYPNLGIEKDPPYTYKDKTDNYDAPLEAQRKDFNHHKSALKAGVFRLNMHPKAYFDRNPFGGDGKFVKSRGEPKERSKSAPSDRKPFKYSSPPKSIGGNKDGCFEKFPKRSEKDPYAVSTLYTQVKNETNKDGKTYYPNKFPKSRPTDSVMHQNVKLQINRQNYKQALQTYSGFQFPQRRASTAH